MIAGITPFLRRKSAGAIFCVSCCALMLVITVVKSHVHYLIFMHATRILLAGGNPYGEPYLGQGGYQTLWVYSPGAVLLFAPFAYLPNPIGLFLFLVCSLMLLFRGLRLVGGPELWLKQYRLFFFILTSELLGSIQATKLEILTTALVLIGLHGLKKQRWISTGFLMGWISSWKFQTLPAVGLILIALITYKKYPSTLRFLLAFTVSFVFAILWPVVLFGQATALSLFHTWLTSLSDSMANTWSGYQSLYAFLSIHFGWPATIQQIGLAQGLSALLTTTLLFFDSRRRLDLDKSLERAVGVGMVYTVLFSPMSQSSAYILGTPLLLLCFQEWQSATDLKRTIWLGTLWFHWIVTSLLYSDLVPQRFKDFAWTHQVKPIGFLCLAILLFSMRHFPFRTSHETSTDG